MGAAPLSSDSATASVSSSVSVARTGRTMSTRALRAAPPPLVPPKSSRSLSPPTKQAPERSGSRAPPPNAETQSGAHRRSKSTHVRRPSVSFKLDMEPISAVLRAPVLSDGHQTPTAERPFPSSLVPRHQQPPCPVPQSPPATRARSASRAPPARDYAPVSPPSYVPPLYTPVYTITLGPTGPVYSPPQPFSPPQLYNPPQLCSPPPLYSPPPPPPRGRSPPPAIGPFQHLRALQKSSHGACAAAQDLATGRVVCTRTTKKTDMLAHRALFDGLLAELLCYRRICAAPPERRAFLMDLHGALTDAQSVVFVMPLMDCDLLAAMRTRVPKHRARRWAAQIAVGLDALHSLGIIHRDVKPENILLDLSTDSVRLADFNGAFLQPGAGALDGAVARERAGSRPYMAPELAARRWYGKGVDWWALGCVVFDLAAGQVLFEDDAQRAAFLHWKPQKQGMSYLRWAADLADDEESVIAGLLQAAPGARYELRHLRGHPYFVDDQGVSVFHGAIYVPSPSTPPPQRPADVSAEVKPLCRAATGVGYSSDADAEYDFRSFEWVNPRGLWGRPSKR